MALIKGEMAFEGISIRKIGAAWLQNAAGQIM